MFHELMIANQERLQSVNELQALLLHREGVSFNRIAKRLGVASKKAKRLVERGQLLFPEATPEELSVLLQARLKKLGQSLSLLVQMVMPRPSGTSRGQKLTARVQAKKPTARVQWPIPLRRGEKRPGLSHGFYSAQRVSTAEIRMRAAKSSPK